VRHSTLDGEEQTRDIRCRHFAQFGQFTVEYDS
jgi:hypothetical protein